MTSIDAQIAALEVEGVVEIAFQNPRADLFFKAIERGHMVIMNSRPFYVHDVEYKKRKDTLVFSIERINPLALEGPDS